MVSRHVACDLVVADEAALTVRQADAPLASAAGRCSSSRGTFSATFFLACLAAMELEGVLLEEI
jgi:hypothetical protein